MTCADHTSPKIFNLSTLLLFTIPALVCGCIHSDAALRASTVSKQRTAPILQPRGHASWSGLEAMLTNQHEADRQMIAYGANPVVPNLTCDEAAFLGSPDVSPGLLTQRRSDPQCWDLVQRIQRILKKERLLEDDPMHPEDREWLERHLNPVPRFK